MPFKSFISRVLCQRGQKESISTATGDEYAFQNVTVLHLMSNNNYYM